LTALTGASVDRKVETNGGKPQTGRVKHRRRAGSWWVAGIVAVALCAGAGVVLAISGGPGTLADELSGSGGPPSKPAAISNVSLTFDSGTAAQLVQARTMAKYGLQGTFFINSGFVGAAGYMSRADLQELVKEGQEIGGHTVTLADLASVSPQEAQRQVCDDRVNLTDWGFKVTSFSYPFGVVNEAAEKIVKGCGYNSARSTATLAGQFGCKGCAAAETVVPGNAYATRATADIDSRWTLADLQAAVTASESNGSWLQMVFSDGVEDNDRPPLPNNTFDAFCAWLAKRADRGTDVRTVHEMIGKLASAAVAGPDKAAVPPGVNALENPGLETPGPWHLPKCWQEASYGKNTAVFTTVTPGLSGNTSAQLQVTDHKSGDAKVLPTLDMGECSPSVIAGHSYTLGAWLTSTGPTQIEVYLRDRTGAWKYWTASPWFPASVDPVQNSWTTPAIPQGAVGLSFGFNLFSDGTIVTDDYSMFDTTRGTAP
jgi:peptidoglycan/xylan/chitin deacetylase (PgdA/CDA1 family)